MFGSFILPKLIKDHPVGQIGCIGTRNGLLVYLQIDQYSTGVNPIIQLAKDTGTPLHRWKQNTLLIDGEGHLLASSEANKALEQVWEILEEAIEHSKTSGGKIHSTESLYGFFEIWCDRVFGSGAMTRRQVELVLGLSEMWGAYVGDRVDRQSLKYFYLEDCIEGGRHQDQPLIVYG